VISTNKIRFSQPVDGKVVISHSKVSSTFKKHAYALALGIALFGIGTISTVRATALPENAFATFNDFSTAGDSGANTYNIYGGHLTTIQNAVSVSFSPSSLNDGLLILKNINSVNFSQGGATAIHLANPTAIPETISFELHDTSDRAVGIQMTLAPNSSADYVLVHHFPTNGAAYGMNYLPNPYPGMNAQVATGNANFDWTNVANVQIYALAPFTTTYVVNISDIRLFAPFTVSTLLTGISDTFGQSTATQGPNHVSSVSDMTTRLQTEQSQLASGPLDKNVDAYQGTLILAAQQATGRFRLSQINGKWWFVTPAGHLFFASGVDQIDPFFGQTITAGRGYMFTSLPPVNSPLGVNYSSFNQNGVNLTTYNYMSANLQQKWGTATWEQPWWQMVISRLQNWGFNCLGSYNSRYGIRNGKLPYCTDLSSAGTYDTVSSGNDLWGPLPDPYDPKFKQALVVNMQNTQNMVQGDPMCYGIYTGIEMSWTGPNGSLQNYGLAIGALGRDAGSSPAKAEFVREMERKYLHVQQLNAVWGTHLSSWSQFSAPLTIPSMATPWLIRDLQGYTLNFLKTYFTTVHSVIKAADPNLLDLGTEMTINHFNPLVLEAAKGIVDAMGLNAYTAVPPATALSAAQQQNIPLLITEWSNGSLDSSLFGTAGESDVDENGRAVDAANYFTNALKSSYVIGANWYEMYDQPLLGGVYGVAGGDNENVGLIDVTDSPYAPVVNSFKSVHSTMYSIRWNS